MKTSPIEHDPWWRLPGRTWCLLACASLISLACSIEPALIETLLWLADFRQWPLWYFALLLVVLLFSLRWGAIYLSACESGENDSDREEKVRFIRLTGMLSIVFFLAAVFHRLGWLRFFSNALRLWFGFGSFSLAALLAFAVVMTVLALTISLIWQWVQSWQE